MQAVYDALWNSGQSHGIVNYGSFAMNVMRMEKAFKGASELTNEVTLPEAGVMRFVAMDKAAFAGKEATQQSLNNALPWVCAYLEIEPDGLVDGHGGEAVLHQGETVGTTSSVVYGHTVGTGLAFAFLKPAAAVAGTSLEVMIQGAPRSARVLADAAWDPHSERPRVDQ